MLSIEKHRAVDFVNNFIALESRFGKRNPFTLMVNPQPCPLVYKDRVYYLANEEERELVMKNPERLMTNSAVPQDVKFVAKVFVIGKTKTGKTTLV